jgi:DNA-binding XRE family transcriptional regulator
MAQHITLDGNAYVILTAEEYDTLTGAGDARRAIAKMMAEDTGRESTAFGDNLRGDINVLKSNIRIIDPEDDDDEAFALEAWNAQQAELKAGRGVSMTKEQWQRIRDGESPVRVVREHRNLTQAQLSDASGVARPEISAIEQGKRRGTVDTYKALAKALSTTLDVLVGD